jgi:hypothetical protein
MRKQKIQKRKYGFFFSKDCSYLEKQKFEEFGAKNTEVGKLIWYMINNPGKFS